jgi:hypothetical protein
MRSMAIRKSTRRRHLVALLVVFCTVALIATSKWDDEEFARMRAEAAAAPKRAVQFVATAKQRALLYAVEESGHREYFASPAHCRVPLRGERLEMQHAAPHDPGRGYRCVYRVVMPPPAIAPVAHVTWSRSPDVTATIVGASR